MMLDRADQTLDALAMLDTSIRQDDWGCAAVVLASDDAERWQGVASVLCHILAAVLVEAHGDDGAAGYVAWRRRLILDDEVTS